MSGVSGNNSRKKYQCCTISSVCGRGLYDGVLIVTTSTITLSILIFIAALNSIIIIASKEFHKLTPLMGINLIFALYAVSISVYQVITSALLLYQARKNGDPYLALLWYSSHLTILVLYFILFMAKTVVCIVNKHYLSASITVIAGVVYHAVFIYFIMIVNSFLLAIDRSRVF